MHAQSRVKKEEKKFQDNLLKNRFPIIWAQLDRTKNAHLKLNYDTLTCGSNKEVWWTCADHTTCNQHSWKGKISNRVKSKTVCKFCSGREKCPCYVAKPKKHAPVDTDSKLLKDRYPLMFAEIHPTLNPDINPETLACGYGKPVVWYCFGAQDV